MNVQSEVAVLHQTPPHVISGLRLNGYSVYTVGYSERLVIVLILIQFIGSREKYEVGSVFIASTLSKCMLQRGVRFLVFIKMEGFLVYLPWNTLFERQPIPRCDGVTEQETCDLE